MTAERYNIALGLEQCRVEQIIPADLGWWVNTENGRSLVVGWLLVKDTAGFKLMPITESGLYFELDSSVVGWNETSTPISPEMQAWFDTWEKKLQKQPTKTGNTNEAIHS